MNETEVTTSVITENQNGKVCVVCRKSESVHSKIKFDLANVTKDGCPSARSVRSERGGGAADGQQRAKEARSSSRELISKTDLDEDALAAAGLGEPALVAPLAEEVERVVEVGHGKT